MEKPKTIKPKAKESVLMVIGLSTVLKASFSARRKLLLDRFMAFFKPDGLIMCMHNVVACSFEEVQN